LPQVHRAMPLVEFDEVLEDQLSPAVASGLDKRATVVKWPEFDRRKTELLG
jgi:hypothetical protein